MGWKTSEENIFFLTGAGSICHTGDANDNVIVTVLGSEIHATLLQETLSLKFEVKAFILNPIAFSYLY